MPNQPQGESASSVIGSEEVPPQEPRSWLLAVDRLVGQAETGKPMFPNPAARADTKCLALQMKSPG